MAHNAGVSDIPLGLQRLKAVDCVTVRQRGTWFTKKFDVTTQGDELLFSVKEESAALASLWGSSRGFNMDMYDANQQLVIRVRRPLTWKRSKVEVSMGGAVTSVVRVMPTYCKRVVSINDGLDHPVLRIKQSVLSKGEYDYKLLTLEKERIGCISRQWSEIYGVNQFLIMFPQNLDVRLKAAAIAACLLINVLYYENSGP